MQTRHWKKQLFHQRLKRRALVGFSAPVGYDYKNQASKTKNDLSDSPNPILYGTSGLFVLFDEIWFACKSLCPENMRKLDYVKFLDIERKVTPQSYPNLYEAMPEQTTKSPSISDMFSEGYNRVAEYAVEGARYDNHTHGLTFSGTDRQGNPTIENLFEDLLLAEKFSELNFTTILNPLTVQYLLPNGIEYAAFEARNSLRKLDVAKEILSIKGVWDLMTPSGPYHEVLEELRGNPLVVDFRDWIDSSSHKWHNRSTSEIVGEVNEAVRIFNHDVLSKAVSPSGIRETVVDLISSTVLEAIPGANMVHKSMEIARESKKAKKNRWKAYCAQSKFRLLNQTQP